jgi:hypothetical protein
MISPEALALSMGLWTERVARRVGSARNSSQLTRAEKPAIVSDEITR